MKVAPVAVALLLLAAPAGAQDHMDAGHGAVPGATVAPVSITFSTFSPGHLDVLAGDTVHWENVSVRVHTVTADDGSFDSDRLGPGETFTRRFDQAGAVPYHCRLHPIPGSIDVHRLLLQDPGPPGGTGTARVLRGRAALPPGTEVTLQSDDAGAGTFTDAASGVVGDDGRLQFTVAPRRTTAYRLAAGADASPARTVVVLDRTISTTVRALRGRRTRVTATVTPASPGTPAVLQLRLPEHFGWWPVARARLDRASRARFTIPRGRRVPARVVLTLPDGATVVATGRAQPLP